MASLCGGSVAGALGGLTTAVVLGLVTSLWHLMPLVKMGHSAMWIAWWWTVWSVPLRIFIPLGLQ